MQIIYGFPVRSFGCALFYFDINNHCATPYFEELGIDLGRIVKIEEESSVAEAVSEQK